MARFLQDVRHSARSLARTPGFTIVAVLCLSLGIGLNTGAFSLINAIALRDLPGIHEQNELVEIGIGYTESDGRARPGLASSPDYTIVGQPIRAFRSIAASGRTLLAVQVAGRSDGARSVPAALTSWNFFAMIGASPALGRFFSVADSADGDAAAVAVVSDAFWRARLDSSPEAVGSVLHIGGRSLTVIGIARPGFVGIDPADFMDDERGAVQLWIPLPMAAVLRPQAASPWAQWNDRWLRLVGRLETGFSTADARKEADMLAARLERAAPAERREARAAIAPLGMPPDGMGEVIAAFLMLMSVPAMVLLVACANVANMLLARGAARRKEIAVRASLGASRRHLVTQLLTESLLIAAAAAVLGIIFVLSTPGIARLLSVPLSVDVPVDVRVLAFTIALVLATTLFFGLVPALRATRPDLTESLKDSSAGTGYRKSRLRSALVVSQIALSLVLIAIAGLFMRTVGNMRGASTGMERERLLVATMDFGVLEYSEERATSVRRDILARVRSLPGVEAVGTASWLPPFVPTGSRRVSELNEDATKGRSTRIGAVSGDFFSAAGIPLRGGRTFTEEDRAGAPNVAVVNEAFVEHHGTPGRPQDIIGTRLRFGADSSAFVAEIVGVVGNTMNQHQDEVKPIAYFPVAQRYAAFHTVFVRTAGDPSRSLAAVRREMQAVDPALPLIELATMPTLLDRALSGLGVAANAVMLFGAVALLLAAAGVYAVMSFIISQRTHEIGVRMALGARRAAVMTLFLRQAMVLTLIGAVIGLAASVGIGTVIASEIHKAKPADPITLGAVTLVLVVVALVACSAPVRRATQVDPMVALRQE